MTEVREARASWTEWLGGVSNEVFFRSRPIDGWDWCFADAVPVRWEQDAEHACQLAAWRRAHRTAHKVGPKSVLLAALEAARGELLTTAAPVPGHARSSASVCGV